MTRQAALGIDIGGTNTCFGLVDAKGKVLAKTSIPTNPKEPAEQLFARLYDDYNNKFTEVLSGVELIGIGVGVPNGNYYTGKVENPPNLKWGTVNIVDILKTRFEKKAIITNDANAAALGEMEFGAAKGMKNFIEITLGTGLGSGIIVNGELVYGADGFAGELGHTIVKSNGRSCNCGKKGCLETYVSAPGIKRTVFKFLSVMSEESDLREVSFNQLNSKMIYEAAKAGDEIALTAFEYTGRILGQALADAVAYLSPEAFILFGGLANAGELLYEPTKKYMEDNLFTIYKNNVKILPSGLPEGEAAVLGASALIWNELNN